MTENNNESLYTWFTSLLPPDLRPNLNLLLDLTNHFSATKFQVADLIKPGEKLAQKLYDDLSAAANKMMNGLPVEYIINQCWFLNKIFFVDERVLIPRPETEELVLHALKRAQELGPKITIADIGTGSGVIAISMALRLNNPLTRIIGIDLSHDALAVAQINNTKFNTGVELWVSDLGEELIKRQVKCDMIVANLPYVEDDQLPPNSYEPTTALFAGKDGLDLIRKLIQSARIIIKEGGYLFLEFGINQEQKIEQLIRDCQFLNYRFLKDYRNIIRMVEIQING